MAINPRIRVGQRYGLALSAHMRQSIALLKMPTQEAIEAIEAEAAENPFLLVESAIGRGGALDFALATTPAEEGLATGLARQIGLMRLAPATEAAALYLVTALRDDGYLDESLATLAEEVGVPQAVLEAGLAALQTCEPAGIGARSLEECFALKLADAGIAPALATLASARLSDFADERWARIARDLRLSEAEVRRIGDLMAGFSSSPVDASAMPAPTVIPEIEVERGGADSLSVKVIGAAFPAVTVLPGPDDTEDSAAWQERRLRAEALVASLAARRETLLRIGRHIAETQRAFFLGAHDTLVPETRAAAAAALGVHPSTLGRAVSGKALLAGHTTYPLGLFFSQALSGPQGAISPFDVMRRIRSLIGAESADAPLADEAICDQLRKEGVDIARRTVAKYRKCMRIPSSFGRKRRKVSASDRPATDRRPK
ncbi:MAG: hypothetical protein KDE00_04485 [Rhodobacteraceae bacterium]|nr:hypothetical protein [Paracoccaceae bacterium]